MISLFTMQGFSRVKSSIFKSFFYVTLVYLLGCTTLLYSTVPGRQVGDARLPHEKLPIYVVDSPIYIVPIVDRYYQNRRVDPDFSQRYIRNNTKMSEPLDEPFFTVHHYFWGTIRDDSFGKNVLIAETAGVDIMDYSIYLLQFDALDRLVSTLLLAQYAESSDSTYRKSAIIREGKIETYAQNESFHPSLSRHLDPLVERVYQVGKTVRGSYRELVTGNYYLPSLSGLNWDNSMETEFFYAFETQSRRPRMYVVGWSTDGNLAYVSETYDDAMGASLFRWHVYNIITNQTMWLYEERPEEMWARVSSTDLQSFSAENFIDYFVGAIDGFSPTLQGLGIIADSHPAFRSFPWTLDGSEVSVRVESIHKRNRQFNVNQIDAYSLLLTHNKSTSIIHSGNFEHDIVLGIRPIGRLQFPYDPYRFAIVSMYVHRGWEGPPNDLRFRLVGHSLEYYK